MKKNKKIIANSLTCQSNEIALVLVNTSIHDRNVSTVGLYERKMCLYEYSSLHSCTKHYTAQNLESIHLSNRHTIALSY